MGTSHKNWWTGRVRHGVGQYYMGTGSLYMLASVVFRLMHPPVVIGASAMLWGYLRSLVRREARYGDRADGRSSATDGNEFRRFLRQYQWQCLIREKPGRRKGSTSGKSTFGKRR